MDSTELKARLEAFAKKGKGLERSTKLWHRFSVFGCDLCQGERFRPETEVPCDNPTLGFVGVLRLHCSSCGVTETPLRVTRSLLAPEETLVQRIACRCGATDFLVADFELLYESDLEGSSIVAVCTNCGRCQTLVYLK